MHECLSHLAADDEKAPLEPKQIGDTIRLTESVRT